MTRIVHRLLSRLRAVLHRDRADRELREELDAHLQLEIDANLGAGMPAGEARRRARAKLGSAAATVDDARDRRGFPGIELTLHDLRLALRTLRHAPGFTLSTIAVLAIGISASTAVATLLHAVAWQPLPVRDPQSVIKVAISFEGEFDRSIAGHASYLSYPEYTGYAAATRTLAGLAAARTGNVNLERHGEVTPLSAACVTGNYFELLGAGPAIGRVLTAADARQPVVVLGYRAWQQRFGGDPAIVGRSILLDRRDYTVVGVADRTFTGVDVAAPDVWMPLETFVLAAGHPEWLVDENRGWLDLVGRVANGATLDQARSEARVIAARFDLPHPGRRTSLHVLRASRLASGLALVMTSPGALQPWERARLGLGVFFAAAAAFVLLAICASNAAGLLLARGVARQREIAVRVALGATRRRLIRQLLAESTVMAVAAGVLGLTLSVWALRSMAHVLPMSELLERVTPGKGVIGFTLIVSAITTLLFGLLPARAATRVDVLSALKIDGPGSSPAAAAVRLRNGILIGQVTVTVVLLIAAALLSRSIMQASAADPGFDARNTFTLQTDLARQGYDQARQQTFVRSLVEGLGRAPEVTAIGFTSSPPFAGRGMTFAGLDVNALRQVQFNICDRRYFDVLAVPLVAGRLFDDGDAGEAAVVNQAFARALWPQEPAPIGRRFLYHGDGGPRSAEVIGIVKTLQSVTVGFDDDPTFYQPASRTDVAGLSLVIAGRGRVGDAVRGAVRQLDSRLLVSIGSIAESIERGMTPVRIGAIGAGLVGVLALIIAAVGIHGVVAYAVARRTREIGVHLALGADASQIIRLMMATTLRPVVLGAIAGTIIAAIGARLLTKLLFGVSSLDPIAFLASLGVLAVAAGVAGYLPARRVLGVGPMAALRRE